MNPEIIKELSAIGLKVVSKKSPDSNLYAKIRARSNPRAWYIPLINRRVSISGLALFQPLLLSAVVIKAAVIFLISIGLKRLWVRDTLFIEGHCRLSTFFPSVKNPVYAFFTGTESPHRKMAVQVMDEKGKIVGYAKLGSRPAVSSLLKHEAYILNVIEELDLKAAFTPKVLYIGVQLEATLLVTDTLKTSRTKSVTCFTASHRAFLEELKRKTLQSSEPVTSFVNNFSDRIQPLKHRLEFIWQQRLSSALVLLENSGDLDINCCLSHGDFTPWNTFNVDGKLYVFDWEYSEECTSQANDILHYCLNQPTYRNSNADEQLEYLRTVLKADWLGIPRKYYNTYILIYIIGQVLRQLERIAVADNSISDWDGMDQQAMLLDNLIVNKSANL